MLFPYQCTKCSNRFDETFPIGKATRETRCPKCKGLSKRVYEGMSIAVKIDGRTTSGTTSRKSTFGEEMKRRNISAAKRQKGKVPGMRLVAHDYGNGDIREA